MALTGPEKAKWLRLKGEILKRPILRFKVNLTEPEAEDLLVNGVPTRERLNDIDQRLRTIRKKNIERLRPVLMSAVGHRGSAQFAGKVGTDSMTIKYLVDGKDSRLPSHDLIAKIEVHLNYVANYELSPENSAETKSYLLQKVDDLNSRLEQIIYSINQAKGYASSILKFDKKSKKIQLSVQNESWHIRYMRDLITDAIKDLIQIQSDLENIEVDYLEIPAKAN